MTRRIKTEETDPLTDYPAEYAACRVDRHRWSRETTWESGRARGLRIRRRECDSCHKVRIETIDIRQLRVVKVSYRDPEGYAMPRMGMVQENYRRKHLAADLAAAKEAGRTGF